MPAVADKETDKPAVKPAAEKKDGSPAAETGPAAKPPTVVLHKVQPGETLTGICMKYGLRGKEQIERVAKDNGLKDSNSLRAGILLRIAM